MFSIPNLIYDPFMSLGKSLFEATIKSRHLKNCPICSGLATSSLATIADMAMEKNYEKGAFLMHEGEPCDGFFLVLSGKVRVYKSSSSGKEQVLLLAEKGMTFGEDGLFGQGTYQEMARAVTACKVLHIPRSHFLEMLKSNPELSLQVMESLSLWIRRLASSVENAVFHSARAKAARYLMDLHEKENSTSLVLPNKKKEIADQLGLAPETLSRAFHELNESHLIEANKRNVQILDIEQLEEACHQ